MVETFQELPPGLFRASSGHTLPRSSLASHGTENQERHGVDADAVEDPPQGPVLEELVIETFQDKKEDLPSRAPRSHPLTRFKRGRLNAFRQGHGPENQVRQGVDADDVENPP